MEQALRTCLLSMNAARELGVSRPDLVDVYYLALLLFVGCTADAHEAAIATGGDEIGHRAGLATVIMADTPEFMAHMLRHFATGSPPITRLRLLASALLEGSGAASVRSPPTARSRKCWQIVWACARTVGRFVGSTFERWDGKGLPGLLAGAAIPLPVRIVSVARDVNVFNRLGGWAETAETLRRRRARAYDPDLTDIFLACGDGWLAQTAATSVWEDVLAAEPTPQQLVDDDAPRYGARCLRRLR